MGPTGRKQKGEVMRRNRFGAQVWFCAVIISVFTLAGCGDDGDTVAAPLGQVDMGIDSSPIDESDASNSAADASPSETDSTVMMPDAFIPTGTGTSPGLGEIIFSEVHYDPHFGLSDGDAEWLEIHNVSNRTLSLEDCTLSDGTDTAELGEVLMPAGGYAVFARNADASVNGNLNVDGIFPFALNNLSDTLELRCGVSLIDRLAYDLDEGFPRTKGFSASLSPNHLNADANDDPSNWCYPRRVYLEDPIQWGTPGGANTDCDEYVDQCRLQSPLVLPNAELGLTGEYRDPVDIFGRVRKDGLTDRTTGNDAPGLVRGQLGFGADGTNPAIDDDWIWIFARPNEAFNGNSEGEPGFDEYQATLYIPTPSAYDFAYRFSVDGGRNWTYCDSGADGSLDGYQIENAGQLDAQPPSAPCEPNPCVQPPRGICEDNVAVEFQPNGTCAADAIGLAECTYEATRTDCSATNEFCAFGRCYATQPTPPINGDVIISEIMYNPDDPRDEEMLDTPRLFEGSAEWIELYNTTLRPITLHECEITDYDAGRPEAENPSLLEEIVIPPNGYAVLTRSLDPSRNGGIQSDGRFTFNLTNSGDTVILRCSNSEIDRVTYSTEGGFPQTSAASLSLDTNALTSADNDLGAAWCAAQDVYLESPQHLGTPGASNPACPRCVDVVCVPPEPTCDGNSVVTYSAGTCVVESFNETCVFPSEQTVCSDGDVCREGYCVDANTSGPDAGDLIFSEIMYNPIGLGDSDAEWFELYNVSGRPLWLGGCQVSDGSGVTAIQAIYAEPDAYILFARNLDSEVNGGLLANHLFEFSLNNNGDLLELRCGDLVIDNVTYNTDFPNADGASLNLSPSAYDAAENDAGAVWCLSSEAYIADPVNLGTPGLANTECP